MNGSGTGTRHSTEWQHTDPRILDLRSPQPLAPSFSAATDKEDEPTLPAGMSPSPRLRLPWFLLPAMQPHAPLPGSITDRNRRRIHPSESRDASRTGCGDFDISGQREWQRHR